MTTSTSFSRADAEVRLGPLAAEAARRLAEAAPPLSAEQRMLVGAVFASARLDGTSARPLAHAA